MIARVDRSEPEQWVEKHGEGLCRYARSRLRDLSAVEDVVQETLLAAYKARKRFSGRSSERTWLIGILRHKIVDHIRKQSRSQLVEDTHLLDENRDGILDRKGRWHVAPAAWLTDPRLAFEQQEFSVALQKCLEQLDERQRTVFVLREVEGLDVKEICKRLGISANNFSVILHRAKARLRELIHESWIVVHASARC